MTMAEEIALERREEERQREKEKEMLLAAAQDG